MCEIYRQCDIYEIKKDRYCCHDNVCQSRFYIFIIGGCGVGYDVSCVVPVMVDRDFILIQVA